MPLTVTCFCAWPANRQGEAARKIGHVDILSDRPPIIAAPAPWSDSQAQENPRVLKTKGFFL